MYETIKKSLALVMALCLCLSLVACDTPAEPVETTPPAVTDAPPAETAAPVEPSAPVETPAPAAEPTPTPAAEPVAEVDIPAVVDDAYLTEQIAIQVENMRQGSFAEVEKYFSPNLLTMLNASSLRDAWGSVTADSGKFSAHRDAKVTAADNGTFEASIVSDYENIALRTVFVYLADGHVDGIWFYFDPLPEKAADKVYKQLVVKYVDLMIKGDFDAVADDFSADLLKNLTSGSLKAAWLQVTGDFGAFVKHSGSSAVRTSANSIDAEDISDFERSGLRTVLSFNADKEITAVWFYVVETSSQKAESSTYKKLVTEYVNYMIKGEFDKVTAAFTPELLANLSTEALKEAWDGVTAELGSFVKHVRKAASHVSADAVEGEVVSRFKENGLRTVLSFNADKQITAVWYFIVDPDAPATPKYTEKDGPVLTEEELLALGDEYHRMMDEGKFDELFENFTKELKPNLSANALRSAWEGLDVGKYIEVLPTFFNNTAKNSSITRDDNGLYIYTIDGRYEGGEYTVMRTQLVLTETGLIDGIWYYPDENSRGLSEQVLKDLAKEAVDLMAAGMFDELYNDHFSYGLTQNLSAATLANVWESMVRNTSAGGTIADYGALLDTKLSVNRGNSVGIVTQKYEHGYLRTEIGLREDGSIDSIMFYRTPLVDNDFVGKVAGYINKMEKGDFDGVAADFTPALISGFNAAALEGAWTSWNLGAHIENGSTTVHEIVDGGTTLYRVTTVDKYANGCMRLMWTMTADGQVANLNNWWVSRLVTPQGLVDEMKGILSANDFATLNARRIPDISGFDFDVYFKSDILLTADSDPSNDRSIVSYGRTWVVYQPFWSVLEIDCNMSDGTVFRFTFEYNADNISINGFWVNVM